MKYDWVVMDARELQQIREAYAGVRNNQHSQQQYESFVREVETYAYQLVNEGYDLSDITWDELAEFYLNEKRVSPSAQNTQGQAERDARRAEREQRQQDREQNLERRRNLSPAAQRRANRRSSSPAALDKTNPGGQTIKVDEPTTKPDKPDPSPTPTPTPTPTSTPTATPRPKPAAQTGDAKRDLDTWAKANPTLAKAAAERARTKGTNQTTNPMMTGLRDRLPRPRTTPTATPAPSKPASTQTTASSTPSSSSASAASKATAKPAASKPDIKSSRLRNALSGIKPMTEMKDKEKNEVEINPTLPESYALWMKYQQMYSSQQQVDESYKQEKQKPLNPNSYYKNYQRVKEGNAEIIGEGKYIANRIKQILEEDDRRHWTP